MFGTLPTRKIDYLSRRGVAHSAKTIVFELDELLKILYGRLAQLVAHLNDIQRVTGSSPVTPTIYITKT